MFARRLVIAALAVASLALAAPAPASAANENPSDLCQFVPRFPGCYVPR